MNNIITRVVRLPLSIRGYTSEDPEGDYNIYINANLSTEMQRKALKHELIHIKRNDFSDSVTLDQAEKM